MTSLRLLVLHPDGELDVSIPYADIDYVGLHGEYSADPVVLVQWFLHGLWQESPFYPPKAMAPVMARSINAYMGDDPPDRSRFDQPTVADARAALEPQLGLGAMPEVVIAVARGSRPLGSTVVLVYTNYALWLFDERWRAVERTANYELTGFRYSEDDGIVVTSGPDVLIVGTHPKDVARTFVEKAADYLTMVQEANEDRDAT